MTNGVNYILLHAAVRMLRLMPLKPSLWGDVFRISVHSGYEFEDIFRPSLTTSRLPRFPID